VIVIKCNCNGSANKSNRQIQTPLLFDTRNNMNCQFLSHSDFSCQSNVAILQMLIGVFLLRGWIETPLFTEAFPGPIIPASHV
jgi:hypothetical protein